MNTRTATVSRTTKETDIRLSLNLDGTGDCSVQTGIGFFDHMLTALAVHGGFDLTLTATGDLEVDGHHTVEDVGIVLGEAFAKALGDKTGIARYGEAQIPMDEALASCCLDVGGRPYLVFDGGFDSFKVGDFETQLTREFFYAFASHAGVTLHAAIRYGHNDHHKIEALFKALAHALRRAVRVESSLLLSTKGVME